MKFLVFGFSVTAETSGKNGYVERCAARCTTERPAFDVTRVGIGGLQPNHARHLIEGILDETKPDALILEIATAVYRQRPKTDEQIADHTATLEAAFEACRMRNMRCGILDLPLTGTSETEDWMVETDQAVARRVGAYAALRFQFGISIGCMEGVQEPLARIADLQHETQGR